MIERSKFCLKKQIDEKEYKIQPEQPVYLIQILFKLVKLLKLTLIFN